MPDKKLPDTEDNVIKHAQNQITESREYVKEKRDDFRDRYRLYNNQRKQRDKIGITTIYNTMNILLAIYYTDELIATFEGRKAGQDRHAENWERLLKFDHGEMEMEIINYITQWDRLFHGVGIRIVSSFDHTIKAPRVYSADPMGWLPDPMGDGVTQRFRWEGFEVEMDKNAMTDELGFFNVENISQSSGDGNETALTKNERAAAQNLGMGQAESFGSKKNAGVMVTNLFTRFEGVPYLVSLAENDKKLVRCQEIKPVLAEERKDPTKIQFPIAHNYFSPQRGSPFSANVGDFTEDKQRAKSVLANIRQKVEQAKLYPMYLYNRAKILNRRDLDFGFNKLIPVNGDIQGAVEPLRKDLGTTQSEKVWESDLDREVQLATGADETQAGIVSPAGTTAHEIQQTQANANLRFILGSRVNAWGEKQFVRFWMREYHRSFKGTDEKVIRVTGRFGTRLIGLKRKDFITVSHPDVKIRSKLEVKNERNEKRISFAQLLPLLLQDPSIPDAAKRFARRHMLKLSGSSHDDIDQMIPPTPDEERAIGENELLSRDEIVPVRADEDHLSDIFIHQQANDTIAARNHIAAHRRMYEVNGGNQAGLEDQASAEMIKSMAAQGQNSVSAQAARQPAYNTQEVSS